MADSPPADLGRRLNNAGGRLLDRAAATDIDTQYLIEAAAEGRFQEALAEIRRGQVSPDTRPTKELELLVAERPLLKHRIAAASGFYAEQWPAWAKRLYEGKPEEVAAALERGEGEAFVEGLQEADKVLCEAARLAPQLTAPAIGRLARIVDEESYEAIKRGLDTDLAKLTREGTLSYNRVFHATGSDGEKLIIKASGNARKARIEAAANYHFSRHGKLAPFVAAGFSEEPIRHGGLSITVQEEVTDAKNYNAHHYMAALAYLHAYGRKALPEEIVVPEWEAKDIEEILGEIDAHENPRPFERLREEYGRLADHIRKSPVKALVHGDAKSDNLRRERLLDLEGLKVGDPSLDIALYLGTSDVPTSKWGAFVETYLSVLGCETGTDYVVDDVAHLTARACDVALVPLLKEYGGQCARNAPDPRVRAALMEHTGR